MNVWILHCLPRSSRLALTRVTALALGLAWGSWRPVHAAIPPPASASPAAAVAPAQTLSAADTAFFENRIRPLLSKHCYPCHSTAGGKSKGDLLLDTRESLRKGGKTGPAITAGDPEHSLMIKAVRYSDPDLQMPPKGEKLSPTQVADLELWVRLGAPDPRTGTATTARPASTTASAKSHWSFQPVQSPAAPVVKRPAPGGNPVDAFIVAKLEEQGLQLSAPADPRTLLRRVYFDLTGLPPTPEEVQAFVKDPSAEAYRRVVDDLLARPQYGERWGRHWLDVARYADTKGEIKRLRETPLYPFAWTYRDYVIRSFNEDKPFDRFIVEQIAADKVSTSKEAAALAALGFLTLGERFQGKEDDIINDRIDVVTRGFLGLSVACARCHDHMFDPIPTKDYYSLRGIFASTHEPAVLPLLGGDPIVNPDYPAYFTERTNLQHQLNELRPGGPKLEPAKRRELLKQRAQLQNKVDALELTHPGAPPRAHVLVDNPVPKDSPVFVRGEAENKGELVPRRFLECLSGTPRPVFKAGSGRLELAQAIASRQNPLTARVLVNRVWQHHFGEGLVATVDDFGAMGAAPTHPELLDYLASHFMEHGESVKELHRFILLSQTYQQASANNPRSAQADPFNHLLWRQNLRRLEFEPLRDSLLALGGRLDTNLYGKPVPLAQAKGRNARATLVLEPSHLPRDVGYTTRRTVYGFVDRTDLPEVFNQFDFANPEMITGRRYETIVPQQALFLMNSPLVVEQARNLVDRREVQSRGTGLSSRGGPSKFSGRSWRRDPRWFRRERSKACCGR